MMKKKAVALILAVIIVVVLTGLAAILLTRSVSESSTSQSRTKRSQAFWLAESGIQRGLWELNHGTGTWPSWNSNGSDKTLDANVSGVGAYQVTVVNYSSNTPTINATGFAPSKTDTNHAQRSVTLTVNKNSKQPFAYAGFGKTSVTAAGNSLFDSYDSTAGAYGGANIKSNADIGTNAGTTGAIIINDNTVIKGDAATGTGGSVTVAPTASITGTVSNSCSEDLPPVKTPLSITSAPNGGSYSVSNSQTLNTGTYKFSSLSVSGSGNLTLNGDVTIYITGDLSIAGNAVITVNNKSTIYVDGKIAIAGNGISNVTQKPSNLLLFSTSTNKYDGVRLAGNSNFYGAVYAPDASVEVAGNGQAFGSLIGDSIYVPGNGQVHYDESLAGMTVNSLVYYSSSTWQDQNNPYPVEP